MSLLIKVIARCLSVVGKRLSESNVTHGRGRLMIFQARQSPSRIDAATVCAPFISVKCDARYVRREVDAEGSQVDSGEIDAIESLVSA